MHSATKYIAGHSDVVIGALALNDENLHKKLSFIQNASGATPGPMDCFLTLRGIKTLHLRMQRHSENAEKIAMFLKDHNKVERVIYPSEVAQDRANKYLSGGHGVLQLMYRFREYHGQ